VDGFVAKGWAGFRVYLQAQRVRQVRGWRVVRGPHRFVILSEAKDLLCGGKKTEAREKADSSLRSE
jgi:hypothetical protein